MFNCDINYCYIPSLYFPSVYDIGDALGVSPVCKEQRDMQKRVEIVLETTVGAKLVTKRNFSPKSLYNNNQLHLNPTMTDLRVTEIRL